jgi:hypothetical protein
MKDESIYCIDGFIPSDEDVVYVNIFKLIEFGKTEKRYGWVGGNVDHGIGTATDKWGYENQADAIIKMTDFIHNNFQFIRGNLDDALEIRQIIERSLTNELKQKQLKPNKQ